MIFPTTVKAGCWERLRGVAADFPFWAQRQFSIYQNGEIQEKIEFISLTFYN